MNKEEWLRLLLANEENLTAICARFNACTEPQWKEAKENNDLMALGGFLQTAWEKAPDSGWIHSIPGWGVLCDLCSEWCFGEIVEHKQ